MFRQELQNNKQRNILHQKNAGGKPLVINYNRLTSLAGDNKQGITMQVF